MWQDNKILELLNIKHPLLLAPMAGAADIKMAIAVSRAGGLGSLACAMLTIEKIKSEVAAFREACSNASINLNFFCHENIKLEKEATLEWKNTLASYYEELKISTDGSSNNFIQRNPFNEEACKLIEEIKPEVVSFHFGLPTKDLLDRVKKAGCTVLSSATTVDEARWLEARGCDIIIAQGLEAGGHRGVFLNEEITTQIGTFSLVPLIKNSVNIPVIAAGGIVDGKSMAAAMILGASAVQIGTAYLFTNEAIISPLHQKLLLSKQVEETALTNIFSGRPARGIMNRVMKEIGPMTSKAPPFPFAGIELTPLKEVAEKNGVEDFTSLWAGQSAGLIKDISTAQKVTENIIEQALKIFNKTN